MSDFYIAGGTLNPNAPCYVEREADRRLYNHISRGEFCYVLTSRQMGKSSLMARASFRLQKEDYATVMIDLTAVGQNVSAEQWYDGITIQIAEQLDLEDEIETFWASQRRLSPVQRFVRAITHVVLEKVSQPIVFFIDEIDVVLSLSFSADEFFGAIRELYNRRVSDPRLERIHFCLLGVASPADLVSDATISPFNVGHPVPLRDFSLTETEALAKGLGESSSELWYVSHQVFYWTQGHPYLTLRLFLALSTESNLKETTDVDRVAFQVFLGEGALSTDPNLIFVHNWLLRSSIAAVRVELIDTYAALLRGKPVKLDRNNPIARELLLSGVVLSRDETHQIRNEVYERVFGEEWIAAHRPPGIAQTSLQYNKIPRKPDRQKSNGTEFTRALRPLIAVSITATTLFGAIQIIKQVPSKAPAPEDNPTLQHTETLPKTAPGAPLQTENESQPELPQVREPAPPPAVSVPTEPSTIYAQAKRLIELGFSIRLTRSGRFYYRISQLPEQPFRITGLLLQNKLAPSVEALEQIPPLQDLTDFRIVNSKNFGDQHFSCFDYAKDMEILYLTDNAVSDASAKLMSAFTKLDALHISTASLGPLFLEETFKNSPNISGLQIDGKNTAIKNWAPISRLSGLEDVFLERFENPGPLLVELAKCRKLWSLMVSEFHCSPAQWLELQYFRDIQELSISGGNPTPEVVRWFLETVNLNQIDLHKVKNTDDLFSTVDGDACRVKMVAIHSSDITEIGLQHIAKLRSPHLLRLSKNQGMRAHDRVLVPLAKMSQLKWLYINSTTPEAIAKLQAARPDLEIKHELDK